MNYFSGDNKDKGKHITHLFINRVEFEMLYLLSTNIDLDTLF